ncbi:MAG: hypothetical protein ACKVVP_10150 [Chloroflexota bacterium]
MVRRALLALMVIVTSVTTRTEPTTTHADSLGDAIWSAYRASTVGALNYRAPRCPVDPAAKRATSWRVDGVPSIDAMGDSALRTWQRMEVQFDGFLGPVSSFRPGADYPEVYIRDVSTMLPALQYFYGQRFIEAGLGEFLGTQFDAEPADPEDALWGSLTPGRGAITAIIRTSALSKMPVVSDEEISLVHAAFTYYRAVGGSDWLKQPVRGKRVIQRLNAALDWIWSTRTDAASGLVKRRHTTDWGDVAMEGGTAEGSLPVQADIWTASIYDQAITYQALRELAAMNRAAGDPEHAAILDSRADVLRTATRLALWQPARGYFRTHLHITPLTHSFDEDAIVSIANAHALYSGIAEGLPEHQIVENLERVRKANGVAKPGLALSTPYANGLFGHPSMGAWSYQNGGVWDWWGGQQVMAEFQQGFSQLGFQHLRQIADDWQERGGDVWEWQHVQTRKNSGSPDYAGAAATATESIIAGLLGVRMEPDVLWLGPRLGARSGTAEIVQPSSGCWVSMTYTAREREIMFNYESNKSGELRFSALIPEMMDVESVRVNDRLTEFFIVERGQDRLVVLTGLGPARGAMRIALRPIPQLTPSLPATPTVEATPVASS